MRAEDGQIADFRTTYVNHAACELLGLSAEEQLGVGLGAILLGYLESPWFERHRQVVETGQPADEVYARFVHRWFGESPRAKRLSGSAVGLGDGIAFTWADVTAERGSEVARRRAEAEATGMFAHAPIGIALVGLARVAPWQLLRVNDALCDLLGRNRDELLGMKLFDLVHPEDQPQARAGLDRLATNGRWSGECRVRRADGTPVWVLLTAALATMDEVHTWRQAVVHVLDVTDRRHTEARLRRLAELDPLTNVFNRSRFFEELERVLAEADRYASHGVLLMLDVDNLKDVNDSLGHKAGDELLAQIAGLLRSRLRRSDVIGRLGGDEFAVLITHVDEAQGEALSRELVETVSQRSFVAGGTATRASVSVGSVPIRAGELMDAEALLSTADSAMYEAKRSGRGTAKSYTPLEAISPSDTRIESLERVRKALKDNSFRLAAQPITALSSDRPDRLELLLRLPDEHGGMSLPGSFLPLAERHNLAQAIDRWVVARAIELIGERPGAAGEPGMNVNLSARSLADPELPKYLERLLLQEDVPPEALELELTEAAAISEFDSARRVATRLRELGCRLALDDFGAGFTSLTYLRELHFDTVKIDSGYSHTVATNPADRAIVRALVDIAHDIGAVTVAEGIEDEQSATVLTELGIDYGQGYHFGRPALIGS
jgi:diguanylate cyclase (GGDEF)-like protein/PAS domain S-box-containing protein